MHHAQIFTGVFKGYFPTHRNEIVTRRRRSLIGPDHGADKSTGSTSPYLLFRPLDHAQLFIVVCGGHFPWRHNEIATRRQRRLVGPDQHPD
jgi:hypothetical protein